MSLIPLANWNGEIMPLDEVRVSVLDRAFLFGDAVYEAMRIYDGRLFLIDRHLARLRRSLNELRIVCDVDRLYERLLETLTASKTQSGLAYLQITRGADTARSHAFPPAHVRPNELLWIQGYPSADPYESQRGLGVSVITHPDLRWNRRDIKTVNLLGNCLAAQAAKEAGAYEAILYEADGEVTEGAHTSVFAVKNGKLLTSPRGNHILPGVTRGFVFDLAEQLDIPVEEHSFSKDDIPTLGELFLTGTTTEVLGIVTVDGRAVGRGSVGPVTLALANAYKKAVATWLTEKATS